MPYSLHYYGKYYIHGEPYYLGGQKRITDITGGCVQLQDKDAKIIFEFAQKEIPVLVIDRENDSYGYLSKKVLKFPRISAESYLVADLNSGAIFLQKNSQQQLPIASLTKLITAVVVAENIDLRKSIFVEEEMLSGYGSTKGLEAGKSFKVVELFYPLLIESSNDAAEVLSYFLGPQRTIKLMNEKAKAILMEKTNFIDASGFSPQNVSTAEDLFILARYILNNRPPLLEISRGKEVESYGKVSFSELENKNLFHKEPNFIGGKTGYILASKYTGLFIFRFVIEGGIERKIAIILLGSKNLEAGEENLKNDVKGILDWLKENYFKTD